MQLQQQAVPLSSLLRPALSLAQETWIHSTEQHEYTYIAMGTGNILEASIYGHIPDTQQWSLWCLLLGSCTVLS